MTFHEVAWFWMDTILLIVFGFCILMVAGIIISAISKAINAAKNSISKIAEKIKTEGARSYLKSGLKSYYKENRVTCWPVLRYSLSLQ